MGICDYADPSVNDLTKCETDAKAFGEFFWNGGADVIILVGQRATKQKILEAMRGQFSNVKSADRIVFYFSGHGYPGGFCPQDMMDITGGLTYDDVLDIMRASRASLKMVFADACYSGAMRRERKTSDPNTENILFFLSSRGSETSAESVFLAYGLFTKALLRGLRGAADYDGNHKIEAKELYDYVSSDVRKRSDGRQHPVMWGKFENNLTIVEYSYDEK